MDNLVSIIIPVYNHEKELKKSLLSIINQTYTNYEVIIVDDGSIKEINLSLISQIESIKNIKMFRIEHGGAPRARNYGFQKSKGEYVIFWDADLIANKDLLSEMVDVLNNNSNISFVYADFFWGRKKIISKEFNLDKLKINNYIITSSLIRRSDFPGFDETLTKFQDWDLWLTLATSGKIGKRIPKILFKILPRSSGISTWLPSFAYKKPWKNLPFLKKIVLRYEEKKKIVQKKHGICL